MLLHTSYLSGRWVSRLAVFSLMICGLVSMAQAQSVSIEIFASRIEALEEGLKDVRGVIEEDLSSLRQDLEKKGEADPARMEVLENQIDKLVDQIRILNNRLERTLEVASDNEFRLLRMEKRLESLMRLGIEDDLAAATSPSGTGAGDVPKASLNAEQDTSAAWTIEASKLEEAMQETAADETASNDSGETTTASLAREDEAATPAETQATAEIAAEPKSVLPDASPDEQYRFALGKALQNDLDTAEEAFREFVAKNAEHSRLADATFWLGRVQFMKGSYEAAAMTFTEFNTNWPTDSRLEKTTLWIAEAISTFAAKSEVCDLLESLPTLVENPTESFFDRLGKLKTKSECTG
ncbi:tetratricopeptide repeat protein [Alphaproteobacteria bacterium LSUCC0684]